MSIKPQNPPLMRKAALPAERAGEVPFSLPEGATPIRRARRLHRRDAAAYLGVSLSWLDKSRMTGTGPSYIAIGGRVVYDIADLDGFLASHKRQQVSG